MQYPSAFIALFAATAVLSIPVPLNINMGAYSPALVVGDGAIGFKGTESVTQIMNTLQGAAASGAAQNGAANAATTPTAAGVQQAGLQQAGVTEAAPAAVAVPETVGELPQGMGKNKNVVARDDLTTEEIAEIDVEEAEEDAEKRDLTAAEQTEIDEEVAEEDADEDESEKKVKRDLTGFNAALNYAAGALKTSPEVQLGTGEGGSGVGITQKPGGATTGGTTGNGTRAGKF